MKFNQYIILNFNKCELTLLLSNTLLKKQRCMVQLFLTQKAKTIDKTRRFINKNKSRNAVSNQGHGPGGMGEFGWPPPICIYSEPRSTCHLTRESILILMTLGLCLSKPMASNILFNICLQRHKKYNIGI